MSRCIACDKILNDYEATRKIIRDDKSIYYPDLCNRCFTESDLTSFTNVVERGDLATVEDVYDKDDLDYCVNYDED